MAKVRRNGSSGHKLSEAKKGQPPVEVASRPQSITSDFVCGFAGTHSLLPIFPLQLLSPYRKL